MDLDWMATYDYMTIRSQADLRDKINKFYQQFYPLKFKSKTRKPTIRLNISRGGPLGIVATYISRILFVLNFYLGSELLLARTTKNLKVIELLKLATIFVQVQSSNLQAALRLQLMVTTVQYAFNYYKGQSGQQDKTTKTKQFLQMKLLCSLRRIFQFHYHFEEQLKRQLDLQGYKKMYRLLQLNILQTIKVAQNHLKLYPEIQEILLELMQFFENDKKVPFNFHSHLIWKGGKGAKKSFGKKVNELLSIIPNRQKQLFLIFSDQNFVKFLKQNQFSFNIPKDQVDNYFDSEEEANALIAQQQNFSQSILVPESYRGQPQWKKCVVEKLVNLSLENKKPGVMTAALSKKFKFSEDFPLE